MIFPRQRPQVPLCTLHHRALCLPTNKRRRESAIQPIKPPFNALYFTFHLFYHKSRQRQQVGKSIHKAAPPAVRHWEDGVTCEEDRFPVVCVCMCVCAGGQEEDGGGREVASEADDAEGRGEGQFVAFPEDVWVCFCVCVCACDPVLITGVEVDGCIVEGFGPGEAGAQEMRVGDDNLVDAAQGSDGGDGVCVEESTAVPEDVGVFVGVALSPLFFILFFFSLLLLLLLNKHTPLANTHLGGCVDLVDLGFELRDFILVPLFGSGQGLETRPLGAAGWFPLAVVGADFAVCGGRRGRRGGR